jgi:hypothetical protein
MFAGAGALSVLGGGSDANVGVVVAAVAVAAGVAEIVRARQDAVGRGDLLSGDDDESG